ncbi:MAG: SRPBCC family protein [Acidimicrobiia bacterium]
MEREVSVERVISASPETLYAMVADVTRLSEWSPENTANRWIGSTPPGTVGARFRGSNASGRWKWTTTCVVIAADAPNRFAFDVKDGPIAIARWEYLFAAEGDGCRVTERWTDHRIGVFRWLSGLVLGIADRAKHNERGMRHTLDALAASAETG